MRTPEEILSNPMDGDTIRASDLGKKWKRNFKYIWIPCPSCSEYRWVKYESFQISRQCKKCGIGKSSNKKHILDDMSKYMPSSHIKKYNYNIDNMPKDGDLIYGDEIGYKSHVVYIWKSCSRCGIYRWVCKGNIAKYSICHACGNANKKEKYVGDKSSHWKGGRMETLQGYIYILIRKDNPYYKMRNYIGYIAKHRLVMAQHLGRCLEKWEIVHHKNHIKTDNRLENLELLESPYKHNTFTIMEREIKMLRSKVDKLETKTKLNEWRIKELEGILSNKGVKDNGSKIR